MAKIWTVWLAISTAFLLALSGCTAAENTGGQGAAGGSDFPMVEIYNTQEELLTTVEFSNALFPVQDGIVYAKGSINESGNSDMEFHYYQWDSQEDKTLGAMEDIAHITRDPVYADGHLYMYVLTGSLMGNGQLHLMDFDLAQGSMTEIFAEDNGDPYNTMTVQGDRLLMGKIEKEGIFLKEYNIKTREQKTLLRFDFDESTDVGETIRGLDSDGETISLLMYVKETPESEVQLRLDVYDLDLNLLRSMDFSFVSSDENERRQDVSHFVSTGSTVYYENYSTTTFLGRVEGNRAEKIMETIEVEGMFTMARETEPNRETGIFVNAFNPENILYRVDYATGRVEKAEFSPNENEEILSVRRDGKDTLLIQMHESGKNTSQDEKRKMYFVPLSELEFEPFL